MAKRKRPKSQTAPETTSPSRGGRAGSRSCAGWRHAARGCRSSCAARRSRPAVGRAAGRGGSAEATAAARAKPKPVVTAPPPARPAPIEPELDLPSEITEPVPGYYGPPGGAGAFERSVNSAQSPIIPTDGIAPADLSDFSSAASRVTREKIDEQEPLTTNDILQTVPGVQIINDDGLGRHGGIGIRGSPARRSRKVLVMEDGRSINMSLWLDPSTHYVPPPDRIESVEVLRGTVIVYGPNNNHGVVNFRNLSPFGPNETVISGSGGIDYDANTRHIHTRQTSGNWGTVLSYSGAEADGAWDNERLRYNDFYTALGWKGVKSDMTLSAVYFRQRDNYDEGNFELEGEEEEEGEEARRARKRRRARRPSSQARSSGSSSRTSSTARPASIRARTSTPITATSSCSRACTTTTSTPTRPGPRRSTASITAATGIRTSRARIRRPPRATSSRSSRTVRRSFPRARCSGGSRQYNHVGVDTRGEFANRAFLWGLKQDVQVGARYEHHTFANRNFFGRARPDLA